MGDENNAEHEMIDDLDSLQKNVEKTKKMLDRQVESLNADIKEIKKEIEEHDKKE